MGKYVRLDKFLADAGAGTRSEVKRQIRKGRVQINGAAAKQPEAKVSPEEDEILLDGKPVEAAPESVCYLLHKPAGCISATEDAKEKTVMDFVPRNRKGLFPVGRLDKDTEGLLLITDDGALAHALLSPSRHVEKTYYALVKGHVTGEDAERLREGVDIGEKKPTLPAKLTILSAREEAPGEWRSEIQLTICEGKYHQVKRMMQALGKKVLYLKRISLGPLTLPKDLPPGQYIILEEEQIRALRDGK